MPWFNPRVLGLVMLGAVGPGLCCLAALCGVPYFVELLGDFEEGNGRSSKWNDCACRNVSSCVLSMQIICRVRFSYLLISVCH